MKLPDGQPVAQQLVDRWLAAFRERHAAGEESRFDPDIHFFHQPVHPEIDREIRGLQARHNASTSLLEVCRKVAEQRAWGSREQAFMKGVTAADYEVAILAARGEELKLLLLQSMDFVKNKSTYESHFGGAIDAFVAACRSLSQRQDVGARWKSLVRNLYQDAGHESDLSPVVERPDVDQLVAAGPPAGTAQQAPVGEGSIN